MRILSLLVVSILFSCLSLFAQYDAGTVIYSEIADSNSIFIQKNYKVVDFDGDNYVDIISVKSNVLSNNGQLTWYKGDGSGNFSKQANLLEIQEYKTRNEIFIADMNEDEINDLVFQNSDISFTILLNDGQGNITKQLNYNLIKEDTIYIDLLKITDMDRDGDMDYIFYEINDATHPIDSAYLTIGYNNGSGLPADYSYIYKGNNKIFYQLEKVDIDLDGDFDIVANVYQNDTTSSDLRGFINIYENTEENGFVLNNSMGEYDFSQIHMQDLNNDGDTELLMESLILEYEGDVVHPARAIYTFQFHVFDYDVQKEVFSTLETYDSWLHEYRINAYLFYYIYGYTDVFQIQFGHQNEDDNLDILSVNVQQGKLLWYLGDGKGGFEIDQTQIVHTNSEYSTYMPVLRVADVDNDDDLDVFVLLNTPNLGTLTLFKNETPVSVSNHNFVFGKMGITPNPVQGNSYIQLTSTLNQNLSKATLYSKEGVKLATSNVENGRMFIPDVLAGVYLIKISVDGKNYIHKLIIN